MPTVQSPAAPVRAPSPARLDANRANALRSTGPRTEEGKARSAANAARHGLTSRLPLGPGEDPGEFEAFADEALLGLAPLGPIEEMLAAEVVAAAWRLRRVRGIEASLLHGALDQPLTAALRANGRGEAAAGIAFEAHAPAFGVLSRYEAAIARRLFRALAELDRRRAGRLAVLVPAGVGRAS